MQFMTWSIQNEDVLHGNESIEPNPHVRVKVYQDALNLPRGQGTQNPARLT